MTSKEHKKKLKREKKNKQAKHYKETNKVSGTSEKELKQGKWMLYVLGAMIIGSCTLVFFNMS